MSSGNSNGEQQTSPEPTPEQPVPMLWINNMTFSGGSNPTDENDCVVLMTMMDNQHKPIGTQAVAKFTSREAFEAFVEWVRGATELCLQNQMQLAELQKQKSTKRILTPGDDGFTKHVPRA